MRIKLGLLLDAVIVTLLMPVLPAIAELQNVEFSGELRIQGNYWRNTFNGTLAPGLVRPIARIPAPFFVGRPIGDFLGGQSPTSYYDWNSAGSDYSLIAQRTLLTADAGFTGGVTARITLESYELWGEDFRSAYVTGLDARAASVDDVEVYEAYLNVEDFFGYPFRLRVGRQEFMFGDGWLVGNNAGLPEFSGLSFDGLRLSYEEGPFSADLFWSKLAERSAFEEDGDIDFAGLYGRYRGIEDLELDAYWLWVRDARHVEDTPRGPALDLIEDVLGLDKYGTTNLHTFGLRAAGVRGAFDFAAEAAWQFGSADQQGALFRLGGYGDGDARFSAWAGRIELGYEIDVRWQPRILVSAAYFGGEDNRDISLAEWLNPFDRADSSISFNRLFSNTPYSNVLDDAAQLSNFWTASAGITASPSEQVTVEGHISHFRALETFDLPWPLFPFGGRFFPLANPFTFLTRESDSDLGWETSLAATYRYSSDLEFQAGWTHLFTGDGLTDGNYTDFNGFLFSRGTGDDDPDYLYLRALVKF